MSEINWSRRTPAMDDMRAYAAEWHAKRATRRAYKVESGQRPVLAPIGNFGWPSGDRDWWAASPANPISPIGLALGLSLAPSNFDCSF